MADITTSQDTAPRSVNATTEAVRQSLARRNRKQIVLQGFGIAAIGFAVLMLGILITAIVSSGYHAFTQTHVEVEVYIDPEEVPVDRLPRGGFDDLLETAMGQYFPDADMSDRAARRAVSSIPTPSSGTAGSTTRRSRGSTGWMSWVSSRNPSTPVSSRMPTAAFRSLRASRAHWSGRSGPCSRASSSRFRWGSERRSTSRNSRPGTG